MLILSTSVQEQNQSRIIESSRKTKKKKNTEIRNKIMASNLNPTFAYVVVYVKDVPKTAAFYAKAFGYNVRRLDQSCRYLKFPT